MTVVNEDWFWYYARERHLAHLRRAAGEAWPWSTDEVIANYHLLNVYRELDDGTIWFHARCAERGWVSRRDVLWASLCYRLANRRQTFMEEGGPPGATREELEWWLARLAERRKTKSAIGTSRHIFRGLDDYGETLRYALPRLDEIVNLPADFRAGYDQLEQLPHVGPFFTQQVLMDCTEAGVSPYHENCVRLGRGALGGCLLLRGTPVQSKVVVRGVSREVYQEAYATARGLWETQPRDLPGPTLTMKNIEHTLCEFVKYVGIRFGEMKGERRRWGTEKS